MFKKIAFLMVTIALAVAVAACSAIQSVTGSSSSSQANNSQSGASQASRSGSFGADPTKMTVEQKLGIGILKLEGTPNAVTAQQAKDLLPLWQALKSMQTSNNASVDEINAIFTQMKGTLTPAQVTAVQNLTWTQADLTALMQQYGIQTGGFGGNNGTLTPAQQATRAARTTNGGGAPGGGGNFGGGGIGGNSTNGGNGTASATRTPSPAQMNRQAIGLNSIFIDPVIKVLTAKNG